MSNPGGRSTSKVYILLIGHIYRLTLTSVLCADNQGHRNLTVIVYVEWTMSIHHYGIYICRFRLVQGVYESVLLYAGRFSNCFKVFHCKVAFEVYSACITAVSRFGQSRLPWNCPEEHCRDNAIKYTSEYTPYVSFPRYFCTWLYNGIQFFSEGSDVFLNFQTLFFLCYVIRNLYLVMCCLLFCNVIGNIYLVMYSLLFCLILMKLYPAYGTTQLIAIFI